MPTEQESESLRRFRDGMALALRLLREPCECGRPDWKIYCTRGRLRYIRCKTCGRNAKIALETESAECGTRNAE
jgi:hypothetical protein